MSWLIHYYKVTWYTCIHGNFQQHFPGYQSFHFPRKLKHRNVKKDSGKILILISNKMHDSIQVQRQSDILVWITTQGKYLSLPCNVNIGIVSMSPKGSPYACQDDFENLGEMICNKSKINLKPDQCLYVVMQIRALAKSPILSALRFMKMCLN